MQRQPFLIITLCFILGIVLQEEMEFSEEFIIILFVFGALQWSLFFTKSFFLLQLKPFLLGFFFVTVGVFVHFLNENKKPNIQMRSKESIVFRIEKILKPNKKNRKYEIHARLFSHEQEKEFYSLLLVPKTSKRLDFLHYYQSQVFIHPIEKPTYNYQFNYQKYLERKNIFYQCYSPDHLKIAIENNPNFFRILKQKRLDLLNEIDNLPISTTTESFLKGFILADRTEMDKEIVSDFQNTGLIHILAISGSHVALIFGIFYFVFQYLFPTKWRKFAIIFSLFFIWFFGVFIGLENSVFRSCLMISIYFVYILLERKPDFLHSVSLSALVILLLDSHQIFDAGFQLSYLAVLGIFWLYSPIKKVFPESKSRILDFFISVISVTSAAQLATLPLVLVYFHQYSLVSFFANLLIIPLDFILITFSFFMVVLIALHLNFYAIEMIYDFFIQHLLRLIHWFSGFKGVVVENIAFNGIEVFFILLILYFLKPFLIQRNTKSALKLGGLAIAFIVLRMGFFYYEQQKSEILVHSLYKENAISVKEKNKINFYVPSNMDTNFFKKYIANPYITSVRANNYIIIRIPKNKTAVKINGKTYDFYK